MNQPLNTGHCSRPLTIPLLAELLANLRFAAQFHSRSQFWFLVLARSASECAFVVVQVSRLDRVSLAREILVSLRRERLLRHLLSQLLQIDLRAGFRKAVLQQPPFFRERC